MDRPLILASQSPRRRMLLEQAGIPYEVHAPDVSEECDLPAGQAVALLSERKALACVQSFPGRFILAADTLVTLDGTVFGKPSDEADAFRMLSLLSGKTHTVFTGVTVISPSGTPYTEVDASNVTFCPVPDEELRAYIRTGEPMDKAGAYAIQGRPALWITHLDGCDSSVIGLPLYLVRNLLLKAGWNFLAEGR